MEGLFRGSLLLLLCLLLPPASGLRLMVTGYNSELAYYNITDQGLVRTGSANVGPQVSWVVEGELGNTLYCMHEVFEFEGEDGGAVTRWVEGEEGVLERKEKVLLPSPGPAHLLVDHKHRLAFTANYGGGSFTVIGLGPAGELGGVVHHETFPSPGESCRDNSHPHQTLIRDDIIWLVDLGCDLIRQYALLTKSVHSDELVPLTDFHSDEMAPEESHLRNSQPRPIHRVGSIKVRSGCGPRHMAFHPSRPLAFVLCEQLPLLLVYRTEGTSMSLIQVQQLSRHPTDYGAEILVQDEHVFATSRGTGILVVYKIDLDGKLSRSQEVPLAGSWPRGFTLTRGLAAAVDQKGDSVQLLAIAQPGKVEAIGQVVDGGFIVAGASVPTPPMPAFVAFVK